MKKYIEKQWEYKGHKCVVLFLVGGYRCGYVGITPNERYYNDDYEAIPVRCHGGLTYGDKSLYGQEDDGTYWVGFDTSHYGDGIDCKTALTYFPETKYNEALFPLLYSKHGVPRSLAYCIAECESIVDQLERGN